LAEQNSKSDQNLLASAERLFRLASEFATNSQNIYAVLQADSRIHPELGRDYCTSGCKSNDCFCIRQRDAIVSAQLANLIKMFMSGAALCDIKASALADKHQVFFVCSALPDQICNEVRIMFQKQGGPNELDVEEQYIRDDGSLLCVFNNVY